MLGLPLAFTIPFALIALAGLPVLYVLLKVTPPRPQRVPFPPLKLILDPQAQGRDAGQHAVVAAAAAARAREPRHPGDGPARSGTRSASAQRATARCSSRSTRAGQRRRLGTGASSRRRSASRRRASNRARSRSPRRRRGPKDIIATDPTTALERLHALVPAPLRTRIAWRWPAPSRASSRRTPTRRSSGSPTGLERGGGRAFAQALAALPGEDDPDLGRKAGARADRPTQRRRQASRAGAALGRHLDNRRRRLATASSALST